MKQLITILLIIFSASGISQETKQTFSLQEAIDFALENNRKVKNAALDIEAAQEQKWETTATGLPQINATVDYQYWLKQQVQIIPASAFGGPEGEFAEVTFGTKQSAAATATLTQLLFDGSYLVGLQSAKVYLEISKNAKEKTDLEVRKAVINAYGNVLLAEESVSILERNINILQKNLDETTKIFENGLEEEESVEQLQITLTSVKSNLNNTLRLKNLAYQMLSITLGLDYNTTIEVTDSLENLAVKNILTDVINQDTNVKNTIDYRIAENDKTSKELLLKLEKSKALPSLSAFVNGAYNAFDDEFVFLDSDTKWFGSSLLGVSMNIPIFSSGMRSAATQRAKINLDKALITLTETEQQLKLQIEAAKSDFILATEEYENKKQNLNLAERIESKNQTKFFEGVGSSFELRQAQTQLYTAQQEFLQAMLDVINTKAELDTLTNTISTY
ncbi:MULTISPECIES: TolC family protein [Mesoflavibacter]|uniref:TolC family protein n=1 Tax=Mesoflavibacter profundi TaxID=2708110 RepID=A0ABT4S2C6_9FLAO|nr:MULTISPECIES: TolC family protein [Mesoflavibacter]MDA0178223.1 TolC family protein [Mesoflavibacter profundi]QIJ89185.1 Efflux system associated with Geranylgeranyl-PP synthase, outer membrane factor (OMF) lipoprotein [Mesoflavibacter sp. HG96]QIJ91913.1 Efflux system associated with Geranylgeranyl-PP synthase, outer membrane factor (OMF) lipoprotein [Mesoflavibacter sp. HG37]